MLRATVADELGSIRVQARLLGPALASTLDSTFVGSTFEAHLPGALSLAPLSVQCADLVVWWEKGQAAEENQAVREIIAAFEQNTGKQVEFVLGAQEELVADLVAALEAGWPIPDFIRLSPKKRDKDTETVNEISAVTAPRGPWNKGKLIGPKPPLQRKHAWAIRTRLQRADCTRDLALFNIAIDICWSHSFETSSDLRYRQRPVVSSEIARLAAM
jgi:hypothetical protein